VKDDVTGEALCEATFERWAESNHERLVYTLGRCDIPAGLLTYAAEHAGGMPTEKAEGPLLALLQHPSALVREGALLGIAEHMTPRVRFAVTSVALNDGNKAVRSLATSLLESTQGGEP
jgi:hypothetical protein